MSALWIPETHSCIAFAKHDISGTEVTADHVAGEALEERLIQGA